VVKTRKTINPPEEEKKGKSGEDYLVKKKKSRIKSCT